MLQWNEVAIEEGPFVTEKTLLENRNKRKRVSFIDKIRRLYQDCHKAIQKIQAKKQE